MPYDEWGVTGYGVAEAADAALTHRGGTLRDARVVIQGFGAVGAAAAKRLAELGAVVVAVSTARGAVHDPEGLDVDTLLDARERHGDLMVDRLAGANARRLDAGGELLLDADVLVPAATQDVIDVALARDLRCTVIVEGANLPSPRRPRTRSREPASPSCPTSSPTAAASSPPPTPWRHGGPRFRPIPR